MFLPAKVRVNAVGIPGIREFGLTEITGVGEVVVMILMGVNGAVGAPVMTSASDAMGM